MSCSGNSRAVFVDTNLSTCFVAPVSPDITVRALKGELELLHLSFYPDAGNIRVDRVMVKRKSIYYLLPESMPLKDAFQGSNRTWFLEIEVALESPLQKLPQNEMASESSLMKYPQNESPLQKLPQNEMASESSLMKYPQNEMASQSSSMKNPQNEKPLESVSVSGIIMKYFSDYDELSSCSSLPLAEVRIRKEQLDCRHVWAGKPRCESFKGNKKLEVGKRLLRASSNLGLTQRNQRPTLSLCNYRNKRSLVSSVAGTNSVFEITDESSLR